MTVTCYFNPLNGDDIIEQTIEMEEWGNGTVICPPAPTPSAYTGNFLGWATEFYTLQGLFSPGSEAQVEDHSDAGDGSHLIGNQYFAVWDEIIYQADMGDGTTFQDYHFYAYQDETAEFDSGYFYNYRNFLYPTNIPDNYLFTGSWFTEGETLLTFPFKVEFAPTAGSILVPEIYLDESEPMVYEIYYSVDGDIAYSDTATSDYYTIPNSYIPTAENATFVSWRYPATGEDFLPGDSFYLLDYQTTLNATWESYTSSTVGTDSQHFIKMNGVWKPGTIFTKQGTWK